MFISALHKCEAKQQINFELMNNKPTFALAFKGSVSLKHQKREKVLKIYCGVEQLVARWAHNPKVVRSSRAPATY